MRLSEPIEKPGFFWLPEDDQNKLPGILRISESGEITLTVNYFYEPHLSLLKKRPLGYPPKGGKDRDLNRIVGIIDNDLVTLDECLYGKWNTSLSGGVSTSTIHAKYAFFGANYRKGEEVTFSNLTFSVDGLDEWLSISGLKVEPDWEKKNVSVLFRPPEEIALNLPDGMGLKFTFQGTLPSFPIVTEAKITQRAYISLISKKLRPIKDFLDVVFKLHNFLCFAIDKPVSIDSITGYSSEITLEIGNGEKVEIPIKVYGHSGSYSETKLEVHRHDMLFGYGDVAEQLEEILTEWIKNYESSEPAFNLYFSTKSGVHEYMESIFLSLCRGIETLHRRNSQDTQMSEDEFSDLKDEILNAIADKKQKRWIEEKMRYANELSLRKRMKQMIEPFKELFGNSKNKRGLFIGKIVDTRNYLTHYDRSLESKVAGGEDLWKLRLKLEALFQLHFLRLIGIDANTIESIVNENRNLLHKLEREYQDSSDRSSTN